MASRTGENICIPKYFMAVRNCIHIFVLYGLEVLFGVLDPRCLTGSALLDCHALKGFGIYMIGILDSLSGVWKPITGTHRVTSTCNLSSII